MTSGIRAERAATTSLGRIYVWLSHYRGGTVELGWDRVSLATPLTAARASICAIALYRDGEEAPLLSGSLRATANQTPDGPAHLVFTGKAQTRLGREEADSTAAAMLDSLAARIASDDLLEHVA